MNRLLLFCVLLALAFTAKAQDATLLFVDKNGAEVPHGATITVSDLVGDNINSGLYVKNTSDQEVLARVTYDVTTLDNGKVQVCFPVTCNTREATGKYETTPGTMTPGQTVDLQSEWFPAAFGRCVVTFRLELMQQQGTFPRISYVKVADGPSVTVVFSHADPEGIGDVPVSEAAAAACYDLQGRRVAGTSTGLLITGGRKVFK